MKTKTIELTEYNRLISIEKQYNRLRSLVEPVLELFTGRPNSGAKTALDVSGKKPTMQERKNHYKNAVRKSIAKRQTASKSA